MSLTIDRSIEQQLQDCYEDVKFIHSAINVIRKNEECRCTVCILIAQIGKSINTRIPPEIARLICEYAGTYMQYDLLALLREDRIRRSLVDIIELLAIRGVHLADLHDQLIRVV